MNRPKQYFEFDQFRLKPDDRTLLKDGQPVPLTPKVFDVLVALVENSGHTLSKNELLETVWPDSVVEENSLNRNISILRKALADNSGNGNYIKTVPKTGYRFEADVRTIVEEEEELVVEKRTKYNLTVHSSQPGSMKRSGFVVAGLLLLVIVGASAGWSYWNYNHSENARKEESKNLYQRGRELWQNRSASGLHEATLLLEQSVERDPENALAYAALSDAYAFDARNWKKVDQIASQSMQLDPSIGNPYASIGFIRLFWQWNPGEAEMHFKQAISVSPDYATAHQWYGIMLASVGHFNEALKEMHQALELEPESVAINADICQMLYFVGRNYEAEAQCKRTLDIDPNFYNAHSLLYQIFSIQGREREAFEAFLTRERLALNAASLPADFEQYRAAFDRGGLKEFWREHIRLRRRFGTECGFELARVHASLGEEKEAIACLQKAVEAREFDLVFIYADPVLRRLGNNSDYDEIADGMMRSQLSRPIE